MITCTIKVPSYSKIFILYSIITFRRMTLLSYMKVKSDKHYQLQACQQNDKRNKE